MRDPRIDEYARLLVDRSVGVQPGWQVFVRTTPLARPLLEAVQEQIDRLAASLREKQEEAVNKHSLLFMTELQTVS